MGRITRRGSDSDPLLPDVKKKELPVAYQVAQKALKQLHKGAAQTTRRFFSSSTPTKKIQGVSSKEMGALKETLSKKYENDQEAVKLTINTLATFQTIFSEEEIQELFPFLKKEYVTSSGEDLAQLHQELIEGLACTKVFHTGIHYALKVLDVVSTNTTLDGAVIQMRFLNETNLWREEGKKIIAQGKDPEKLEGYPPYVQKMTQRYGGDLKYAVQMANQAQKLGRSALTQSALNYFAMPYPKGVSSTDAKRFDLAILRSIKVDGLHSVLEVIMAPVEQKMTLLKDLATRHRVDQ